MEVAQGKRPVGTKDGATRRPEPPATEAKGVGMFRGQWWGIGLWGLAAPEVASARPEAEAQLIELFEEGDPSGGEPIQVGVDRSQFVEALVTLGLQRDSVPPKGALLSTLEPCGARRAAGLEADGVGSIVCVHVAPPCGLRGPGRCRGESGEPMGP